MLAGFFVQAAFYFCCNEIIETILANKMEKYQHKISTLETFKTAMSMGKKRSAHEIADHMNAVSLTGAVGRKSINSGDEIDESVASSMEIHTKVKTDQQDHERNRSTLTERFSSFFGNAEKRQRNKTVGRKRTNSISRGGLGGEALTSVSGGGQYKWARHRAEIFQSRGTALLIWSVYMSADVVLRMIIARKDSKE